MNMKLTGHLRRGGSLLCLVLALILTGCAGKSPLDPKDPVSLTVWHYYNGSQQAVSDLESAVRDAIGGKVGAEAMPDIFSSYADTAYEVEQAGALADLSAYLGGEELEQYVDSYIEEGRIASDGTLRIFPTAKSTEIMMLNKTDWDAFSDATGASLDALVTIEGVVETAKAYYEWTDGLTPDVPGDGKAFYGRDAMANYFIIGMQQQGVELFQVEGGEMTLNVSRDALRRLWENYYVPMVKGYFGAYGSFRSDDVKTGEILAYTGSTTSAMYFPDQVELDSGAYPIDYLVLPAPILDGGQNYAVQQGAGMVVSKSDERHEYAAVEFLKWFTQTENNLRFGCVSGYLPVRKDAGSVQELDKVIEEQGLTVAPKTYDCLTAVFERMGETSLYTNKSFRNGSAARKVLEYHLADQAAADRAAVAAAAARGEALEDAAAPYVSDAAFESWYTGFCEALRAACGR